MSNHPGRGAEQGASRRMPGEKDKRRTKDAEQHNKEVDVETELNVNLQISRSQRQHDDPTVKHARICWSLLALRSPKYLFLCKVLDDCSPSFTDYSA